MKGWGKTHKTKEEEIGKLPEKEFRVMLAKMVQNLKNRMGKTQESFNTLNKDPESDTTEAT